MRWLIAAGGTGGHIFPALSVAKAIREGDPHADFLFVGTGRGLERRAVAAGGFDLRVVHASGLVGLGWRTKIMTILGLPRSAFQCLKLLLSYRPQLVLGMGGFAAGPVVLLAAFLGIPSAIGEQNAVAGRTNRVLGRFVKRVFISFPESAEAFPPQKVRMTGNPVRPELLSSAREIEPPSWRTAREEPLRVLIFGGSQGALGINQRMLEAVPRLRNLPFALEVKHQAGATLIEELGEAYSSAGIPHQVVPFIEEMDEAYRWAHMVLCRAGATSLAELALFRRPSVLVPYPFSADDHQRRNAQVFERAGAAFIAEGGERFVERLESILRDIGDAPETLEKMGENAGRLARPNAAAAVAEECLALAQGGQRFILGPSRSPRNG